MQANDVKDAYDVLAASLADTVGNFEIPSVQESPILDVFPYYNGEEEAPLNEAIPENYTPVSEVEENDQDIEEIEEVENVE